MDKGKGLERTSGCVGAVKGRIGRKGGGTSDRGDDRRGDAAGVVSVISTTPLCLPVPRHAAPNT